MMTDGPVLGDEDGRCLLSHLVLLTWYRRLLPYNSWGFGIFRYLC
jgi:hypothetical protein